MKNKLINFFNYVIGFNAVISVIVLMWLLIRSVWSQLDISYKYSAYMLISWFCIALFYGIFKKQLHIGQNKPK